MGAHGQGGKGRNPSHPPREKCAESPSPILHPPTCQKRDGGHYPSSPLCTPFFQLHPGLNTRSAFALPHLVQKCSDFSLCGLIRVFLLSHWSCGVSIRRISKTSTTPFDGTSRFPTSRGRIARSSPVKTDVLEPPPRQWPRLHPASPTPLPLPHQSTPGQYPAESPTGHWRSQSRRQN